jgi:hypothetical protein
MPRAEGKLAARREEEVATEMATAMWKPTEKIAQSQPGECHSRRY